MSERLAIFFPNYDSRQAHGSAIPNGSISHDFPVKFNFMISKQYSVSPFVDKDIFQSAIAFTRIEP